MKKQLDRVRKKTDKILGGIEDEIAGVYAGNLAIKRASKKYHDYMEKVDKQLKPFYKAYQQAIGTDQEKEAKDAYIKKAEMLTLSSRIYADIIQNFTYELAKVNQEALNVVNNSMKEIYMINYNQVAEECEKVGIEVENG